MARLSFKTEPRRLCHLKNLLEGYDNLALMSIVDAPTGHFELLFPEKLEPQVRSVMAGIKKELPVRDA